jgi:hypothetical protein
MTSILLESTESVLASLFELREFLKHGLISEKSESLAEDLADFKNAIEECLKSVPFWQIKLVEELDWCVRLHDLSEEQDELEKELTDITDAVDERSNGVPSPSIQNSDEQWGELFDR